MFVKSLTFRALSSVAREASVSKAVNVQHRLIFIETPGVGKNLGLNSVTRGEGRSPQHHILGRNRAKGTND